MEKYLITGFSGFVSRHFIKYLEDNSINAHILGVDLLSPDFKIDNFKNIKCTFEKVDLLDKTQVDNIIYQFQPMYVLHLASFSSVAFSWKEPIASFKNNTNIFLNLLEMIRALNLDCRILSIGSSEEYGNVSEKDLPLKEDLSLNPVSPYAVARVSQEMLSRIYHEGYSQDIVITRSFNHLGPGQKDIFAISSFIKQMVRIRKSGLKEGELATGDISIVRDLLDVRDVVKAYYGLFKKGKPGEVYNVCSGRGIMLEEIIGIVSGMLKIKVHVKTDQRLIRPNDNKTIIGSNEKLKKETGWEQTIFLEQSLKDMIAYWESHV